MQPIGVIKGIVIAGQKRGKKLGFPTINISLSESFEEGIYFSHIVIEGKKYNALTFIGSAKTFNEQKFQAETYVLDFDKDIYGQMVEIQLLKKIRDNQKFVSVETLIAQMEEDKRMAEEFFTALKS